ncbi:hypothetical protein LO749_00910 [Paracoccus denitrificans]|uniref:hypothetical protein n=1 Tax=Paracoccus denitrificans TaxID=266 RepID=UPI001E4C00E8|nr:hypothetical protein [Paracoccus denitrificans]UFS65161.1 hypothetical protein LO749_00910 [Paracoccus denitrificans]
MANPRIAFKQTDVTRAIKGALAAGFEPGEFRIAPDGTIQVLRAGTLSTADNRIDQMIGARHGKA